MCWLLLVWGRVLQAVAGLAWVAASVTRLLSFDWTEAENKTLHFSPVTSGHLNPGQNSRINPLPYPDYPHHQPSTSRALFPITAQTKCYIRKLLQASAKRKAAGNIKARHLLWGKAILYFSTSRLLIFFVFSVEAFQISPPRTVSPYLILHKTINDMQMCLFSEIQDGSLCTFVFKSAINSIRLAELPTWQD